MKRQSFVLSAIILALGGFFAKAIGAIYKIPLTNILGSNGMGVYYLIFPIYSLIIVFCSSGISVALSVEVSKCRKIRHRYNEQKYLRVALIITFVMSVILAIVTVFLSHIIAEAQGNVNAKIGYIAIAPAIILSSMIATVRGYFQGIENMVPTTVSMIIEQIIKLSVGLVLAHKLCVYGIDYAVLGAILGVTISEVVALIIIVINFITYKGQLYYNYKNLNYKRKSKKYIEKALKSKSKCFFDCNYKNRENSNKIFVANSKSVRLTTKKAWQNLMKIATPCTLSSILIPISTMLDSFMIINVMSGSGYSVAVSTSLYGIWGGVIQSLISLPTIIVSAISTSMVPSLSGLIIKNDTNELRQKISFYIKLTFVLSISMFIIFYVFAEDILRFLYGNGLNGGVFDEFFYATKMLKICSLSIIYYSFLQTFTSILQTCGQSSKPFFALLLGVIIRTGLIYALVSVANINIFGAVIANIVFLSVTDIIMAVFISRKLSLEYKFYNNLLKPFLMGIIVLLLSELARYLLINYVNYIILTIILTIVTLAFYMLLVYFGKVFSPKELKSFAIKRRKISK